MSFFMGIATASFRASGSGVPDDMDGRRFECIFDSMSIFSSFSSSKSFNSLTSASKVRTLSSNDSVYPRGNARRLSLSLVLHSKPTFEHCEQHGRIPSHLIFLLRQRSQAWAIRLCEFDPTFITFIGSIPGMFALSRMSHGCCSDSASVLGSRGPRLLDQFLICLKVFSSIDCCRVFPSAFGVIQS
jgi:hypothetical protein